MRPYHTKHLKHIKPDVSALRFSYSKCVEQYISSSLLFVSSRSCIALNISVENYWV